MRSRRCSGRTASPATSGACAWTTAAWRPRHRTRGRRTACSATSSRRRGARGWRATPSLAGAIRRADRAPTPALPPPSRTIWMAARTASAATTITGEARSRPRTPTARIACSATCRCVREWSPGATTRSRERDDDGGGRRTRRVRRRSPELHRARGPDGRARIDRRLGRRHRGPLSVPPQGDPAEAAHLPRPSGRRSDRTRKGVPIAGRRHGAGHRHRNGDRGPVRRLPSPRLQGALRGGAGSLRLPLPWRRVREGRHGDRRPARRGGEEPQTLRHQQGRPESVHRHRGDDSAMNQDATAPPAGEPVAPHGGRPLPLPKSRAGRWLQRRLPIDLDALRYYSNEPVPNHLKHWWWCLGGTPAMLFAVQAVTGILLSFYYVPDPSQAYESVKRVSTI